MILHGSFIKTEMNKGEFIFWGEKGKTRYKRRGRAAAGALPIYEDLIKPEELPDFLYIDENEFSFGSCMLIDSSGKIDITPRELKGIFFEPFEVMMILPELEEDLKDYPEISLSEELIFWITAFKLAVEFIQKNKYYPELFTSENNNKLYTQWCYYSASSNDQDRLQLLCDHMPPVCKSYFNLRTDSNDFKITEAKDLLEAFINWLINGIVREIQNDPVLINPNPSLYSDTPMNRWLSSLKSPIGVLALKPSDVVKFKKQYSEWLRPVHHKKKSSDFRTCFRIMEPEKETDLWEVEYLLRGIDDPSIILTAAQVWKITGDSNSYVKENKVNLQEKLLEDLGLAARIYYPIEKTLYTSAPVSFRLSLEEMYEFLNGSAYLLEENGFGIIAPSWYKRPMALSLKLKSKGSSKSEKGAAFSRFNMDTILEYDWQAAVGEIELSEEEFKKLSALKTPLVQLRGQWVEIKGEQLEALSILLKKKNYSFTVGDILRQQLSGEEIVPGVKVKEIENDINVNEFIKGIMEADASDRIPVPDGFHGTLRKYQQRGLNWLSFLRKHNLGGCLADDMGLGKTIQMICLLLLERELNWTDKATLLVCPTSVVGNWEKELIKFSPSLKVLIHHGSTRMSEEELKDRVKEYDVVITTYSILVRDEETLKDIEWAGVVLDEAQNIKNTSTKQTQAVKKLKAGYRIALTGTPVENRLSDLWSIMDFAVPGYLYNQTTFREKFSLPVEKYRNKDKGEVLKKLIAPFVLRRVKTDPNIIQDLPEKIETKEYINLTREQATLYEAVVKDMLEKVESSEGIERKGLVLSALTKLKQVCNHPRQLLKDDSKLEGRSGKLMRLIEMLEEIAAESDRALIFTQFAEMGEMLEAQVKKELKIQTFFLHGATTRKKREEMITRFQQDGEEPMVFILSLKAGGVGLNLTKASHVFHFDRWWNPAIENQATDRAFRIGQTKNVQVHKFICSGTLEEKIDSMLEEKQALADSIVSSGETWISEMSNEELRDLFRLRSTEIFEDDSDRR